MMHRRSAVGVMVFMGVVALLMSCTRMYHLPDAPAQEEWQDYAVQETESEEVITQRILDAKRAAIQVYAALSSSDWDKALALMSKETQAMLAEGAEDGAAATALASGVFKRDGVDIAFDPVADIFIEDVSSITDEFGSHAKESSERRQLLFAVGSNAQARKIIMIREGDSWVLHTPSIPAPLIEE